MLISIEDLDNVLENNDVNNAYTSFNNTINQFILHLSHNVARSFKNKKKK